MRSRLHYSSEIEQLRVSDLCRQRESTHKGEGPCTGKLRKKSGDHGRDVHSTGGSDEQAGAFRRREAIFDFGRGCQV